MGNVQVQRLRAGRFRSKMGLVVNYPGFLLKALSGMKRLEFDVVHAHDLDTLLVGTLVSRLNRVPLIYDAHEHYADMVSQDLPAPIARLFDLVESTLVPCASRVIVANPGHFDYLREWAKEDPVVVMNCVDPPEFSHVPSSEGPLTFFYAGSLEPLRFIEEAIDVIGQVEGVRLRVAGDGSLRPLVEEASSGHRNIEYIGYLNREELYKETAMADIVIALLDPINPNNRMGIPNRLMEAMAIGTPVVVSTGTESGRLVEEVGCGLAIGWGRAPFLEAIGRFADRQVREEMGRKGRRAAIEKYNWGIMKGRLIEIYDGL